ncbi:MAG: DUF3667 domain-containing protein [Chitinophagales bacterium]|nr:DUF3667 domain-containing protein [Chitinophagales bacterium]
MISCKNCETQFEGKFCPECGQDAKVKRLTIKDFGHDILHKVLPWDKGFLYTIRRLLTDPGHMIREYVEGKRVKFHKPLSLIFIVLAFTLIFLTKDSFQGMVNQQSEEARQLQNAYMDFIMKYMNLVYLAMVPSIALFSFLLYRKYNYNFAEHMVLNLYLLAGSAIVTVPFSIYNYLTHSPVVGGLAMYLSFLAFLLYYAWGYNQFFQETNKVRGGLKAVASWILGYFTFFFVVSIIAFIVIVAMVVINGPESFKPK